MATYNTRWQFSFVDYSGTIRWVYIQQKDYTGSTVTTLTAGDNPISWDEESTDNLLTSVRGKTGHLEVYEMQYGELAAMIPATSTEMRVLCPGLFFGYIKAQSSDYAWQAGPRKMRFNIQSPLAMAYDVKMPIGTTDNRTWDSVMKDLLDTIGYGSYIYPDNVTFGTFSGLFINPLAHDKEYHCENDDEAYEPISVGALLEAICNYYGLMVHDDISGETPSLLFTSVKYIATYHRRSWSETLSRWVTQNISIPQQPNNLLTGVEVAGNSNKERIVMPYSDISIRLGGGMFGDCDLPTDISEYSISERILIPRGNWFTNNFPDRLIPKVEIRGEYLDGAVKDTICCYEGRIPDNAHMFTMKMVEYDRKDYYYNLVIRKQTTGVNKLRLYITSSTGGLTDDGTFSPSSLGKRDIDFTNLQDNEAVIQLFQVPSDYLMIEVYKLASGYDAQDSYIYDVKMVPRQYIEYIGKYIDKSFVKRLTGGEGSESITIERILNDVFTTNYYDSNNGTPEDYAYLLYSQLRLQITIRSLSDYNYMLYLLSHVVDSTGRTWRVIAVSANPCENTYKITLHHSQHYDQ
jgi:hypothetical protein